MNELFAITKEYGKLFFDEIFIYYDGPCLFSVKNQLDHCFIVLLENINENSTKYLLVPVSYSRYIDLVSNRITIKDAFVKSETGEVFTITFSGEDNLIVSKLDSSNLNDLNLPEEGEYLDLSHSYYREQLIFDAVKNRRGIAQISFEKNGRHEQSISAMSLSAVSKSLQKVMDGIRKDWENNDGRCAGSRRKSEMRDNAELMISKTFAASFGIQIESKELNDILLDSDFDWLMEKFVKLTTDYEDKADEFYIENTNAINALINFYKVLMINDFAIKFQMATPKKNIERFHHSILEIKNRYNYLTSKKGEKIEQIEEKGKLIAFDLSYKTFKFKTINGDEISGKFDDEFEDRIFDTENVVIAYLNVFTQKDIACNNHKKYVLLKLRNS